MKRIVVVGCGGLGKSTVARRLGRQLDLPVTHLGSRGLGGFAGLLLGLASHQVTHHAHCPVPVVRATL